MTTITLSSPADIAAAVPYLMGFTPDGVVFAVFTDGRLTLCARFDWPTDGDVADALLVEVSRLRGQYAGASIHVIGFGGAPDVSLLHLAAARVTAASVGYVDGGAYYSAHLGWESALEPDHRVAAEFVALGVAPAASREAAVDLSPVDDPLPDSGTVHPARAENDLVAWITAGVGSPDVAWLRALGLSYVREPVMFRLEGLDWERAEACEALGRVVSLVRRAPGGLVAPVASTLAAFAWARGNGVLAVAAAECALGDDPGNVLARLVAKAVGQGVPPSAWVELLNAQGGLDVLRRVAVDV